MLICRLQSFPRRIQRQFYSEFIASFSTCNYNLIYFPTWINCVSLSSSPTSSLTIISTRKQGESGWGRGWVRNSEKGSWSSYKVKTSSENFPFTNCLIYDSWGMSKTWNDVVTLKIWSASNVTHFAKVCCLLAASRLAMENVKLKRNWLDWRI